MVSVIIVNYNTYQLTVNCIASVIAHTKGTKYEIILVDNYSTECNPELFKQQFPQITLIKNFENSGFAKGNNAGIEVANGENILLLNSDTVLLNDAISISEHIIEKDASIGVLSGKLIYPDGRAQNVTGRFPRVTLELFEIMRLRQIVSPDRTRRLYQSDMWDYNLPTDTDWIWGAFFFTTKKIIDQFPGKRLHDEFFMYFEDVLWCYYIKRVLHKRVFYSPEPLIMHYLSASSNAGTEREKYRNKILPNEIRFLRKQKGKVYTVFYYLLKAMHQFSLRKKENIGEGKFYFNLGMRQLLKQYPNT